ncbi:unnamed protein product, partial [Laminaria digitata]
KAYLVRFFLKSLFLDEIWSSLSEEWSLRKFWVHASLPVAPVNGTILYFNGTILYFNGTILYLNKNKMAKKVLPPSYCGGTTVNRTHDIHKNIPGIRIIQLFLLMRGTTVTRDPR